LAKKLNFVRVKIMCLQARYKKQIWEENDFFASLTSLKKGVGILIH
jgi:hypothetical protein